LPPASRTRPKNLLLRYFARFDDGEVARWAFRGLLIGAVAALLIDLRDLGLAHGWGGGAAPADTAAPLSPAPGVPAGEPMRFTLVQDGVLEARGNIDAGASARLVAELEARGEYVATVSLDSPGGVLTEAIRMAEEIRKRGLNTRVENEKTCASSCPLMFAGGVRREAAPKAHVGVHQFYASDGGPLVTSAQALADAQATTATISRHLRGMDVDPALWLHALDTPPGSLYMLSREELSRYRLVTQGAAPEPAAADPS
jgi:hypothetical protein